MNTAIFGLGNTILDLFVTLALISLVAIWGALIVFTFNDARKRLSDPFLIACATAGSFFPFVGTLVYTILRPQELLEDVQERDWDLKATQAVLRQHRATSCRKCGYPAEPDFLKCPSCRSRLREPCPSCDRPVGIEWKLCPYCEKTLIEPSRKSSRRKEGAGSTGSGDSGRGTRARAARTRAESGGSANPKTERKPRSSKTTGARKAAGGEAGSSSGKSPGAGSRKPSGARAPGSESPTAENPSPRKTGTSGGSSSSKDRPINSPEPGEKA
jgi:predicted Zn-ribbon and HTH transcriptional regulator